VKSVASTCELPRTVGEVEQTRAGTSKTGEGRPYAVEAANKRPRRDVVMTRVDTSTGPARQDTGGRSPWSSQCDVSPEGRTRRIANKPERQAYRPTRRTARSKKHHRYGRGSRCSPALKRVVQSSTTSPEEVDRVTLNDKNPSRVSRHLVAFVSTIIPTCFSFSLLFIGHTLRGPRRPQA